MNDKGDDDHAMADYNLPCRCARISPRAYNNRGTLYMRKGALQSALDDFNAAVKIRAEQFIARSPTARGC